METNSSRWPCPVPCRNGMCPRHNPYTRTPEHKKRMSERMKSVSANRKRVKGKFVKEDEDDS